MQARHGAQILWECLVREGRDRRVRLPRRRHSARLRRDARVPDSAHAGAPRAGRHAHGGWLCARQRDASAWPSRPRALARPTWSPGIATAMMDSSPIVCITGQVGSQPDRLGRVSGNRHHRRHAADHQAQLPRAPRRGCRRRPCARRFTGAVPDGPGPVLHRHHQGCAADARGVRLGRGRPDAPGDARAAAPRSRRAVAHARRR